MITFVVIVLIICSLFLLVVFGSPVPKEKMKHFVIDRKTLIRWHHLIEEKHSLRVMDEIEEMLFDTDKYIEF